jgi:uncharacterized protein (TIGR04222 family)
MNPFDLNGPQFLIFYSCLFLITYVYIKIRIHSKEGDLPIPKLSTNDPYMLAYLRAGKREALKLATIVLFNRGFLTKDKKSNKLKITKPENADLVSFPVEKSILHVFKRRTSPYEIFESKICEQACEKYQAYFEQHNLNRNTSIARERLRIIMIPATAFLLIGAARIVFSLQAGKTNLWFLSIIMVLSFWVFSRIYRTPTTLVRTRVLEDFTALLSPGRKKASTREFKDGLYEQAMFAAVFGLPYEKLPEDLIDLFADKRKSKESGDSGFGWGCSSCSSCGGGGGCGGCGGCGT